LKNGQKPAPSNALIEEEPIRIEQPRFIESEGMAHYEVVAQGTTYHSDNNSTTLANLDEVRALQQKGGDKWLLQYTATSDSATDYAEHFEETETEEELSPGNPFDNGWKSAAVSSGKAPRPVSISVSELQSSFKPLKKRAVVNAKDTPDTAIDPPTVATKKNPFVKEKGATGGPPTIPKVRSKTPMVLFNGY
jgi:hypothetical protein